jgi:hypothetical protein
MTAATTDLIESNGAGPTDTGSLTNVNAGSNDSYNIVTATYPIVAGTNSFEKWHRIKCTAAGTSTSLNNWKVWLSTGSITANCTLKTNLRETSYGGAQSYAAPSATDRSATYGYTQTFPTTTPSASNLGYGGTLGAAMTISSGLPKYTDYIVMQLQTTGSANTGLTGGVITYQYDETS